MKAAAYLFPLVQFGTRESLSLPETLGDEKGRISQRRERQFMALCIVSQGNTVQ